MAGGKRLSSVFSFPNEAQTRLEKRARTCHGEMTNHIPCTKSIKSSKVQGCSGWVLIIDRIKVHILYRSVGCDRICVRSFLSALFFSSSLRFARLTYTFYLYYTNYLVSTLISSFGGGGRRNPAHVAPSGPVDLESRSFRYNEDLSSLPSLSSRSPVRRVFFRRGRMGTISHCFAPCSALDLYVIM